MRMRYHALPVTWVVILGLDCICHRLFYEEENIESRHWGASCCENRVELETAFSKEREREGKIVRSWKSVCVLYYG